MAKMVKKAQSGVESPLKSRIAPKGPEFRPGQVKRMTRVFEANPERGVKVAKRMLKRANVRANASEEMKKGGSMKKAKSGGSFPDLNKDGKITKADILKGRGVIAKKGAKTAKKMMKNGGMLAAPTKGGVSMQLGSYTRQIGKNYTGKNVVNKGAKAKMGKSMGKCKNGC